LYRILSQHFKRKEKIIWNNRKRRLRYIGYIINLTVQTFLFQDVINIEKLILYNDKEKQRDIYNQNQQQQFRFLRLFGKLYNIVVYI